MIRAYRTVSDEAVLLLARSPLADMLAEERCRISRARATDLEAPLSGIRARERAVTIADWQRR
jgi:hypothetical protein